MWVRTRIIAGRESFHCLLILAFPLTSFPSNHSSSPLIHHLLPFNLLIRCPCPLPIRRSLSLAPSASPICSPCPPLLSAFPVRRPVRQPYLLSLSATPSAHAICSSYPLSQSATASTTSLRPPTIPAAPSHPHPPSCCRQKMSRTTTQNYLI